MARALCLGLLLVLLQAAAAGPSAWHSGRRPPSQAMRVLLSADEDGDQGEGAFRVEAPDGVEDLLRRAEGEVKALRSVLHMEMRITRAVVSDSKAACLLLARLEFADWFHSRTAGGGDLDDDYLASDRRFEQLLEAVELNLDALDAMDVARLLFALQRHGDYDADLRRRAFERLEACLRADANSGPGADPSADPSGADPEPAPQRQPELNPNELSALLAVVRMQLSTPPQFDVGQMAQDDAHGWWDACASSFAACGRCLADAVEGAGGGGGGNTTHTQASLRALAAATWATEKVLEIWGLTPAQLEDVGSAVERLQRCVEAACAPGAALGGAHSDADTAVLLCKACVGAGGPAAVPALQYIIGLLDPTTDDGKETIMALSNNRFGDFISMLVRAADTMPGRSRRAA
eukprot:CAMPEP_0118863552 /NCGR_PEP_ID=MMETSP1163-20130328/8381_1 /TAXON_ID=124430 /ORGANISM="Phaeomonas parva, Strain CCMP2877" /LENGTH=405 /DNA_ID=CAMNT_0006797571 /DNA_START=231 /DNA_END=1445 /DNA_ORIENTATION=-